jgi:hypothetical protein
MEHRTATREELLSYLRLEFGRPVRFRHFVVEQYYSRGKNGVRHVQHSRAKIIMVDGAPSVRHHGRVERLTASACNVGERWVVYDVRLNNPYLE